MALWETHWGLLSVQEHREETLIYDVEVVKYNAVGHRAYLAISGLFFRPLGALLGSSWGSLGAPSVPTSLPC